VSTLGAIKLSAPRLPFVSSTTGTWIRESEATDPEYWVRHLRNPILFDSGLRLLLANPTWDLLELGPGDVLSTLAKRPAARSKSQEVFSAVRRATDESNDVSVALTALGSLWARGASVDWKNFRDGEPRQRVGLPTYAFERQRYWVVPRSVANCIEHIEGTPQEVLRKSDISDWFYEPVWKQSPPVETGLQEASDFIWLVFAGPNGLDASLAGKLAGARIVTVLESDCFEQTGVSTYTVDAWDPQSYRDMFLL
jgi:acyl transferase domain-containing protein